MQRVVERILNLLAFLLTAGRPVTADEIRHTVHGYDQEGDDAFRRTFERDKDLLRKLGVPLRLEHTDAWEVEQGYVVSPEEYALPDPGLTDDERVALHLAARMVRLGGQSPGLGPLLKLGGGAPAVVGGDPFTADLGVDPDTLGELFSAIVERRIITFDYNRRRRQARPLALLHRIGHWYLVAHTPDGERRVYRVDRMSDAAIGRKPEAFERPKGFRASDDFPEAPWEAGEEEITARVRFDGEIAWWARRHLRGAVTVRDEPDGAIVATFPVASAPAFIGWLLDFEEAAEILDPPDLRSRFVDHLRGEA